MPLKTKTKLILIIALFLVAPLVAGADYPGQKVNFFIDPDYDIYAHSQTSATLKKISTYLYFYIDDNWWNSQNIEKQNNIDSALSDLAVEFDSRIYYTLTSIYGLEWKPGIDKDERITVLIHPMKEEAGGYFNSGDEYPKLQNTKSNEREMVYLNAQHIDEPMAKSLLAHEFTHLITFNQKDKIHNVSEEIWLNEARAEYTPTLMGYDNVYKGSNLQNRVEEFLKNPQDSLTEWQNKKGDYGVLNLFTQYLIDHYGVKILADSLHSSKIGIPSINEALSKNGLAENFSQIFTNFTIAALVNNCQLGEKYCYSNQNLKDLRITPQINFLPLVGESVLMVTNLTADWAGNWQKIIGGKGVLTLEFDGADEVNFKVPYLICDYQNQCQINSLILDEKQSGKITLTDFNKKYTSLIIIPSIQSKISGFDGKEISYPFSVKVTTSEKTEEEKETELKKQLLAQIDFLQKEIAKVQAQINEILAKRGQLISCQRFDENLYFGMMGNSEVRCLQEFLKAQGPEIYPEGLITGNFLNLTQAAIIRFQEKYATEILVPLGLEKGTGFVGERTRTKINNLISK